MHKPFIHGATGMTGKMIFEPRPEGRAVIGIEHLGEREEAVVVGDAKTYASLAFKASDVDRYIALWRANRVISTQKQELAA